VISKNIDDMVVYCIFPAIRILITTFLADNLSLTMLFSFGVVLAKNP
jgi:hypothetical protein